MVPLPVFLITCLSLRFGDVDVFFLQSKVFALKHIHYRYPGNPPSASDHFHTDTVVPSSNHCRTETELPPNDNYIDTVAPSSDHYYIGIVVPSSDHCCTETVPPCSEHYGTTKVAPRRKEGRKEHIYLTKRETTIQYIFMKMQWSGDCR